MILIAEGSGFIDSNFVLDWFEMCSEPAINLDKLAYAGNLQNFAAVDGDAKHIFVKGQSCDSGSFEAMMGVNTIASATIQFWATNNKQYNFPAAGGKCVWHVNFRHHGAISFPA